MRYVPPNPSPTLVVEMYLEYLQQIRAGLSLHGPLQKLFYQPAIEYGTVPIRVNSDADIRELSCVLVSVCTSDAEDAVVREWQHAPPFEGAHLYV